MSSPEYPLSRDQLYDRLRENNIYGRRYFYPLISEFPMYRALPSARRSNLPVASALAERVLCLPIYPALTDAQVGEIAAIVRAALPATAVARRPGPMRNGADSCEAAPKHGLGDRAREPASSLLRSKRTAASASRPRPGDQES